jgi:hypothetical protein
MKLGATVNVGGFNSMKFESNERASAQEAARDLINQMEPLARAYPVLQGKIQDLRSAYNV